MSHLKLKVKRLHQDAVIPVRIRRTAFFDIRCIEGGVVEAKGIATLRTGLAFKIPEGWAMLVYSLSGHRVRDGVQIANTTEVVDSYYHGELMVKLANNGEQAYAVEAGESVAQAVLTPVVITAPPASPVVPVSFEVCSEV